MRFFSGYDVYPLILISNNWTYLPVLDITYENHHADTVYVTPRACTGACMSAQDSHGPREVCTSMLNRVEEM